MSPTPNSSSRSRKSTKTQTPSVPEPPVQTPTEVTTSSPAPENLTPPGELNPPGSKTLSRPKAPSPLPTEMTTPSPSPQTPSVPQPAMGEKESSSTGILRNYPISPPSEARQYRAIGLVKGRYLPSPEQFTKGILQRSDGVNIDSVLLGRVMSLVKNHLNLEEEHFWVVYPRTRQEDGNLHTQIMGVWEPETLKRSAEDDEATNLASDSPIPDTTIEDGYFSIRGEVIFQSQDEEHPYVVVKIKQSPRKTGDKVKFFKLKMEGTLPERGLGFFWNFQASLQGDVLFIKEANNVGPMPIKKKKPFKSGERGERGKRPFPPRKDAEPGGYRTFSRPDQRGQSLPKDGFSKPIKRSKPL